MTDADDALVGEVERFLGKKDFANFDVLDVPAYHHTPSDFSGKRIEQEFFERTVNAAWLVHLQGIPVSGPAIVSEDPDLPLEKVRNLLDLPRFLDAAADRGIPRANLNYLTTEMIGALRALADSSLPLTSRQRLKKLGISWEQYQGWLDYPPFRKKHREMMKRSLDVSIETGDRVLAEKIEAGDLNAIKYANEMTGKFVPGTQQQASFLGMISVVISVLQRHIPDPTVLQSIVNDIDRVMLGAGIEPQAITAMTEPDDNVQLAEPLDPEAGPG